MDDRPSSPSGSDFYVGYLAAPSSVVRLARTAALVVPLMMLAFGATLATTRRDPGPAVWEDGTARTFVGVVQASPFPMLHLLEPSGDVPAGAALLIVEVGKHGGGRRAAPLDGRRATLSGFLLTRDGRRMIELEEGPDALRDDGPGGEPPTDIPLGYVELVGEIVDSKCYLGAMKPGEGRVHQECAIRCISAGIPPMLVASDAQGRSAYLLLSNADGAALGPEILPFVGTPARVTGHAVRRGDLLILQTSIDRIDDIAGIDVTATIGRHPTVEPLANLWCHTRP